MAVLNRRKRSSSTIAQEIKETVETPVEKKQDSIFSALSTGSVLLDLAISGGRIRGGGIPGGKIVEIFGPPSSGKTAILSEIAASCQSKGGKVKFEDPEGRLDEEYSRIYGMVLSKEDYDRPDTVTQVFDTIWNWKPGDNGQIHTVVADSLAALSTEMELDDGDAYGMRRAKEFSEGLRKTCRMIANNNWLIACSNQEREGPSGITTPGGKGIPFYASLRIRVSPLYQGSKIVKEKTIIEKKKISKVIGIRSICEVKKSSIDEPFRTAPISIIFNYGIDTIRDELMWYKEVTGGTKYECPGGIGFGTIDKAISYVEENNLVEHLKDRTIDMWGEIEEKFKIVRARKKR